MKKEVWKKGFCDVCNRTKMKTKTEERATFTFTICKECQEENSDDDFVKVTINLKGYNDSVRGALEMAFDRSHVDLIEDREDKEEVWVVGGSSLALKKAQTMIQRASADLAGIWKQLKDGKKEIE